MAAPVFFPMMVTGLVSVWELSLLLDGGGAKVVFQHSGLGVAACTASAVP